MSEFKLSKSSKKNLKGVEDAVEKLVLRVIAISVNDFGIPKYGGKRSPQEQNNLFHRIPKVTQLDGFKRKSYHQSGWAFDVFIYDEHGACWDCKEKYKELWLTIESEFNIMKEEGLFNKDQFIQWGGNWTRFKDLPHFQIVRK